MMTSVCLAVLCGLPASGKTTFVHQFIEFLRSQRLLYDSGCAGERESSEEEFSAVHLCYDELVTDDVENQWSVMSDHVGQEADIRTGLWKQYRSSLLKCLEEYIIKPRTISTSALCENNAAKSMVTETLIGVPQELVTRFQCIVDQSAVASAAKVVVFLDDNMYYSSMRHSVHQLARQYSLGFIQVYFPVRVELAIERNRERGVRDRVPADVIQAMSSRLEVPSPTVNSWERLTTVVDTTSTDHPTNTCATVLAFIQSALTDPDQPLADPEVTRRAAREACLASDLHSADTFLRKLISQHMKSLRETTSCKQTLSAAAARLNTARTEILSDLRSGLINFSLTSTTCHQPQVEPIGSGQSMLGHACSGLQHARTDQQHAIRDQEHSSIRSSNVASSHDCACAAQEHSSVIQTCDSRSQEHVSEDQDHACCGQKENIVTGDESSISERELFETLTREFNRRIKI